MHQQRSLFEILIKSREELTAQIVSRVYSIFRRRKLTPAALSLLCSFQIYVK